MITKIWACLPIDGKMKEETLYGWTLTPEQVAEWKENAEAEDEPVEYVQFIRKADAEAAQALLVERAKKAEEDRVSEWNKRRDADGSRDAARAACDSMRAERDDLRARLATAEGQVAALTEAASDLAKSMRAIRDNTPSPGAKVVATAALRQWDAALATVTPPAAHVKPHTGQIIAECDCPDGASCQIEGRCLAEGGPSCG